MIPITHALRFWHFPLEMGAILHPMRTIAYDEISQSECVTHAETTESDDILRTTNEVIPKTFRGLLGAKQMPVDFFES